MHSICLSNSSFPWAFALALALSTVTLPAQVATRDLSRVVSTPDAEVVAKAVITVASTRFPAPRRPE